jgi:hypothetical protein
MPLPEWGYSYNALSVPLANDWQCSLVPARDVQDIDRDWALSYEQRQKARREREEHMEQDRRDFDRLFRVSISRRAARACSNFSAYAAFVRDELHISGLSAPVDGGSVTAILRDAVRNGLLIPAIDRTWPGSRRVTRFYAPQNWPKRAPDPKPIVHGVRNGQFIPLNPDGTFVDYTPYMPVKNRIAATASCVTGSGGGFDWPGAIEAAAGAAGRASENSSPLGNAQAFGYLPDMPNGDAFDIAKTPNAGEPGTWYTNAGSGQMRLYGIDGRPSVDLDFDHDHGQGRPHAHNWSIDPLTGKNVRGPGVPFSLLK